MTFPASSSVFISSFGKWHCWEICKWYHRDWS